MTTSTTTDALPVSVHALTRAATDALLIESRHPEPEDDLLLAGAHRRAALGPVRLPCTIW